MVRFEVLQTNPDGSGQITVEIKGAQLDVKAECVAVAKAIAEAHPELVKSFILGFAMGKADENELVLAIKKSYAALRLGALLGFGELQPEKKTPQATKPFDKNEEKCKNCNDKDMKKNFTDFLKDLLSTFGKGDNDE